MASMTLAVQLFKIARMNPVPSEKSHLAPVLDAICQTPSLPLRWPGAGAAGGMVAPGGIGAVIGAGKD